MNRTIFNQTGGFPLKTERLQEQQTAFEIFNALGFLAGDLTIISGCEMTGTTIADGKVFIGGELLYFRSAVASDSSAAVVIIEEPVIRSFENGTTKTVHIIRYATIGTAETSWLWSSFVRPVQTKTIEGALTAIVNGLTNIENRLTPIENKLNGIESGAQKNVQADWAVTNSSSDAFVKNKFSSLNVLGMGSVTIGNITPSSYSKVISFADIGTSDYQVLASVVSKSTNFNLDNNVFAGSREHTATSFRLLLREITTDDQNISVDYIIIKK